MNMDLFSDLETALMGMTWNAVPSVVSLSVYVFSALGLYTLAQRRGLRNAWLAWIPVVNVWILGSLSDQYRYVVRGEVRSKRKVLLTLSIVNAVLVSAMVVVVVAAVIRVVFGIHDYYDEDAVIRALLGNLMGVLALFVPLAGVGIASAVLKFMALYDVYTSCDPQNNVVYLVLSILFSFTQAIFLFLCRNKDDGMPPRRDAQPQPRPEPWEQQDTNETNYF